MILKARIFVAAQFSLLGLLFLKPKAPLVHAKGDVFLVEGMLNLIDGECLGERQAIGLQQRPTHDLKSTFQNRVRCGKRHETFLGPLGSLIQERSHRRRMIGQPGLATKPNFSIRVRKFYEPRQKIERASRVSSRCAPDPCG